jgi:hypothetical protein
MEVNSSDLFGTAAASPLARTVLMIEVAEAS